MKSNIETYLRLKPLLPSDYTNSSNNNNTIIYEQPLDPNNQDNIMYPNIDYQLSKNNNLITIQIPDDLRRGYVNNLKKSYDFKFTDIFLPTTTQEEIFTKIGKNIINNSLEGYNNTVFCYGQTGSGKTYTMCGSKNWKERGIIPRLLVELFKSIRSIKTYSYDIFISYLEIYNENAYDLLDKAHADADIEKWRKIIVYEDTYNNIMLKNLSMIKVENEQQALDLLITGNYVRHISSTQMNMASSRSHAIFTCILEGRDVNSEVIRASKINLVDLAGSERMKSNFQGITTVETKYINLSLSFLEQVIIALNEKDKGNRIHIPYRNSLMTTILKDSLGGNCKTVLIANVSSNVEYLDETMSTMRFAARCAKVQNEIIRNEQLDLNMLVSKLQSENKELRKQLAELRCNSGSDNGGKDLEVKRELTDFEKDECKIIISEYLNDNSHEKTIQCTNANQLYYIIDFLIEYINTKEKTYKEKMMHVLQENKELIQIASEDEDKMKMIIQIIHQYKLTKYFDEVLLSSNNNNTNESVYTKVNPQSTINTNNNNNNNNSN
jgi:kinesin family protein 6/9